MFKIVKTDDAILPSTAADRAAFDGLDVDFVEKTLLAEDDLIAQCADAFGLIVLRENITARVIASLPKCKVISRMGVGVENVDVAAATKAGIKVANVPDANVDEVSSHAMAMILSLTRNLTQLDAGIRAGRYSWQIDGQGLRRMSTMVLGLIGFGNIGRETARKAQAFGFKLIVYDPGVSDEAILSAGARPASLDEIIRTADIISLHTPLTASTADIIDAERIAAMKPGAILINVSRGGLVDEIALADALHSKHLRGAGFDAFRKEPLDLDSPLRSAPNILLSPHGAHYSREAIAETSSKAFLNVAEMIRGRPPLYCVN
jgi:D-3-phosphoglycerate dehydrogenase